MRLSFILILFIIVSFITISFGQSSESSSSSGSDECPEGPFVEKPPTKVLYPNDLPATELLFHETYMQIALDKAIEHNAKFGAAIVHLNGTLLCTAANTGTVSRILHAEMRAILNCSELYGKTTWEDHYLYTTGEPCVMCSAAIMWTKFKKVIFGSSVSNMYCERCFNQLPMDSGEIFKLGYGIDHNITSIGGVLEAKTDLLFPSLCNEPSNPWAITPLCRAGWKRTCPRQSVFESSL